MGERNIAFKVDEQLFKRIKIRLTENNMTLKDYITSLIRQDLAKEIDDINIGNISDKDLEAFNKVMEILKEIISEKYEKK